MTPTQIEALRAGNERAKYMGLSDEQAERCFFELSECSTEALIEELYCRGWLIVMHGKGVTEADQ
jgi:hypothetical protein